MTSLCPNCNQTVLPADIVCWHCGYRLSPQSVARKTQPKVQTAVAHAEPFSVSAVIVYSMITAVILTALLLTMRVLGQQPLVLLNPETNINSGWLPVTDYALRFTFDIPPTWQSWDKENPRQRDEFNELTASEEQLVTAIAPLSKVVPDMEILMIVMGERAEPITLLPGFVVVAHSEAIGRLSLDEISALAQQNNSAVALNEITRFRSFLGDNRVVLSLTMPQTPAHLTCQQHIITNERGAYLLAGCAPAVRNHVYSELLEKVLASFQPLR